MRHIPNLTPHSDPRFRDLGSEDYSFRVETSMDSGEIRQSINRMTSMVIRTQEAHIREALIRMGWTPPGQGNDVCCTCGASIDEQIRKLEEGEP